MGRVLIFLVVVGAVISALGFYLGFYFSQHNEPATAPEHRGLQRSTAVLRLAPQRTALVMGNADYSLGHLQTPEADARMVAAQFARLGFDLMGGQALLNADQPTMEAMIDRLFDALQTHQGVGVVYYAGHGMQFNGVNYLIPLHAKLKTAADAKYKAISADFILSRLNEAGSQVSFLILDACRNNPYLRRFPSSSRSRTRPGLAELKERPRGSLVAFSTAAGDVALDVGKNGINSPYTEHLLAALQIPNLVAEVLFRRVRTGVLRDTQDRQEPTEYNALRGDDFFFNAVPSEPVVVTHCPQEVDIALWQSAQQGARAADYQAYLAHCPAGIFAKMAQNRLLPSPSPVVTPPKWVSPSGLVASLAGSPGLVVTPPKLVPPSDPSMVRFRGGRFQMGSPSGEKGREKDEVQHEVQVGAFSIGRYEVTVGEFRHFVDADPYQTEAEQGAGCRIYSGKKWSYKKGTSWRNPGFAQTDQHPVVCVSWKDAQKYIAWLNQQTREKYRLPTEAEWEYAARAGTKTARYWGEEADQACHYANVADQTLKEKITDWPWTIHDCQDGYGYTAPVGRFQTNATGLYDMLGNVWEWACSEYQNPYNGAEKTCNSNAKPDPRRVLRGGAWTNGPRYVRATDRYGDTPDYRNISSGFRLAQD